MQKDLLSDLYWDKLLENTVKRLSVPFLSAEMQAGAMLKHVS